MLAYRAERKSQGWLGFQITAHPELVQLLKLTARQWRVEHPQFYIHRLSK